MPKGNQHISNLGSYYINDEIDRLCRIQKNRIKLLENADILFTGASGFFGFWFLKVLISLHKNNHFKGRISVITRDESKLLSNFPEIKELNCFNIIEGDVKSVNIGQIKPDHLIHFASTSASETYNHIEQSAKLDTLYLGTQNIFEQCGESLEKVLFASSGAAYGDLASEDKIKEDAYSRIRVDDEKFALCLAKLSAEFLIHSYSKKFDFNFSIARCFSFAGEYMPLDLHYAFGNFIKDALIGNKIVINGDGKAIRSYMYIGDAVNWLLTLLLKPKNEILNIGSDDMVSIQEVADFVARKSKSVSVTLGSSTLEGNFSRSVYVPDLEKIRTLYPELELTVPWKSIVERMLRSV